MSIKNYDIKYKDKLSIRLVQSAKGKYLWLILFFVSVILLWWNEGRAVQISKGLAKGIEIVKSVSSTQINIKNNGDLIHIVDKVISSDTLFDSDFNVNSTGLKMKRKVEMYQWHEQSNSNSNDTIPSRYTKAWSEKLINFKHDSNFVNPSFFPYKKLTYEAKQITIGAFDFPIELLDELNNYEQINIKNNICKEENCVIRSNEVYIGSGTIQNPNIGDVKISFYEVSEMKVSIISQQKNNTLIPFNTENESRISLLEVGDIPANKMFETAQGKNVTLTWVFRFLGLLMMFFSLKKTFNLVVMIVERIPFIGHLINTGITLFSIVMTLVLTSIIISTAWITYRPIVALTLLLGAIGVLIFIFIKTRKENSTY